MKITLRKTTIPLNIPDKTHHMVRSLAFSPNASTLAAGTAGGEVLIWNTTNFDILAFIKELTADQVEGAAHHLAFNRDGKSLVVAGGTCYKTGGLLTIIDTGFSVVKRDLTPLLNAFINGLSYHPSGKFFATADAKGFVRLWAANGDEIKFIQLKSSNCLSFSPNGNHLIVCCNDCIVYLDSKSLNEEFRFDAPPCVKMAVSPTHQLATAGDRAGQMYLWADKKPIQIGKEVGWWANDIAFNKEGDLLIVPDGVGAKVWDTRTYEELIALQSNAIACSLAVCEDLMAIGGNNPAVAIWNNIKTIRMAARILS